MSRVIFDTVKNYAAFLMIRDSSLSRETEQFSFIRTIKSSSNLERHEENQNTSEKKIDSDLIQASSSFTSQEKYHLAQNNFSDRDRANVPQNSSALCARNNGDRTSLNTYTPINSSLTVSHYWYSSDNFNHHSNLATVIVVPEIGSQTSIHNHNFNYYLDRILLLCAGGYLCFILWWLFGSKNAVFPVNFISRQETISQEDADFIDYMQQSLELIDRNVTNKQSSTQQITSSEKKDSEVVYIPVFTPTAPNTSNEQLLLPQPPPPPPLPNQLAAINPPVAVVPLDSPVPPSESVKIKTTPTESASITDQQTKKSTSSTVTSPEMAAAVRTNINHTLVGVMELKEGSAALFKINGVTQRIWLGEKIENTGWVLKSVANQKVTISRQDKSLTLSVGETF